MVRTLVNVMAWALRYPAAELPVTVATFASLRSCNPVILLSMFRTVRWLARAAVNLPPLRLKIEDRGVASLCIVGVWVRGGADHEGNMGTGCCVFDRGRAGGVM
jgi:hypothetical protein